MSIELAFAVRILMALVFLTAAHGKLLHRTAFQGVLANYRLLPETLVAPAAWLLPIAEIAVTAGLLFAAGSWPEIAAAALLLLFATAMAINLKRGRRSIDCGCFQGTLRQTLRWVLVARNLGLVLVLAGPVLWPSEPPAGMRLFESLATGAVLFVLLQSLNVLWSVRPSRPHRAVTEGAKS